MNYHLILPLSEAAKTFRGKKGKVCENMSESITELIATLSHREFSSQQPFPTRTLHDGDTNYLCSSGFRTHLLSLNGSWRTSFLQVYQSLNSNFWALNYRLSLKSYILINRTKLKQTKNNLFLRFYLGNKYISKIKEKAKKKGGKVYAEKNWTKWRAISRLYVWMQLLKLYYS